MGLSHVRWHNHFVVPRLDSHLIVHAEGDAPSIGKGDADLNTAEDEDQILSLRPSLLEQLQRHNIWRHLHPDLFRDDDTLFVNHFYAEAVYAPLYYGYGDPGSFADRRRRARTWDAELLLQGPDIVLVLIQTSANVIRARMRREPRPRCILKEEDVDEVLGRFHQEYEASLIPLRFSLDTTNATVAEVFKMFQKEIQAYLSDADRLRLDRA